MTAVHALRPTAYHPHIDGLRAVAIALVLLYHFDFGGAAQGFLGVDIFFVLSGFLIGGIVQSAMAEGRFGLIDFYRRRLARIAPALLLTAALTLVAGYWLLLPGDLAMLAREIRAACLSIANWHYAKQLDYLAELRRDLFFLHSWSLSVEAQFYLGFPLIALLLHRAGRYRRTVLVALLAASLAAYLFVGGDNPRAAFYFSSLRAWEFLLGVMIAATPVGTWKPRSALLTALAGALAMLIPAFMPLSENFLERSAWQLLCVTGTALLLVANLAAPANPAARLLAMPWVRGLGLMSYSLYLIHWPLLMLARNWHIEPLPATGRLFLLLASVLLAWVGCYAVERPVRRWANRPATSAVHVYGAALAAAGLIVAAASWIMIEKGFPGRLSPREQAWLAAAAEGPSCGGGRNRSGLAPPGACHLGDRTTRPDVAVWGDSHSRQPGIALGNELGRAGRSVARFTATGCPPLVGAAISRHADCAAHNDRIAARIAATPGIETVVLTFYYGRYAHLGEQPLAAALQRTVALLRRSGKRVIIIGPLPKPHYDVPTGLARREWNDRDDVPTAITEAEFHGRTAALRAALAGLAKPGTVLVVDPGPSLCAGGRCPYRAGGIPLYSDDNHVTAAGAAKIARQLMPLLPPPNADRDRR